jgi:DNA polymerase-3 subunit delta'
MTISIKGHAQQIAILEKQSISGRLPNAYLFAGPNAIGKGLVAKFLSRDLACLVERPRPFGGCGKCIGCRKVLSDNHPDRFYIEAEDLQIKIGQIRELGLSLHFHPLESQKKVVIVDEAERMNESTANSMLKILEEPPPDTHFILISASPHMLLPTIRSRCQKIYFQPLRNPEVIELLVEKGYSQKEATKIAKLSGGSVGLALTIDPSFVDGIIGRFLALCANASSADIIETSDVWSKEEPPRMMQILDVLASCFRDLLRFGLIGDAEDLIHPEIARFVDKKGFKSPEKGIEEIEASRRSLGINANKQLMFENLLFTLMS